MCLTLPWLFVFVMYLTHLRLRLARVSWFVSSLDLDVALDVRCPCDFCLSRCRFVFSRPVFTLPLFPSTQISISVGNCPASARLHLPTSSVEAWWQQVTQSRDRRLLPSTPEGSGDLPARRWQVSLAPSTWGKQRAESGTWIPRMPTARSNAERWSDC